MEVIIPKEETEKKAVHPIAVFKYGWSIVRKNAVSFCIAYLIIYLPLLALNLAQILFMDSEKPSAGLIIVRIVNTLVSSWGFLVLIRIASSAAQKGSLRLQDNIKGSWRHLLYYMGASIAFFGSMLLVWALGGLVAAIGAGFFWKVNKFAALVTGIAVLVACVSVNVYFFIRWSLYQVLCVVEQTPPIAVLKRSRQLVKDYVNPVAGEFFLLIAISMLLIIPPVVSAAFIHSKTAVAATILVYYCIINIIWLPVWAAVTFALYLTLKEAVQK